jgi:ABC-type transporter Mla subunit MlaD
MTTSRTSANSMTRARSGTGEPIAPTGAGRGRRGTDAERSQEPMASAVDTASEKGGELVERAKSTATRQANSQRARAATTLDGAADAMRQVSDRMRQDEPSVASVTAMAADRTQDIARYLQQTDVNDMIHGVEDFARRQPLLFLGGAFALGLLGSRLLKASMPNPEMSRGSMPSGSMPSGSMRPTGPGPTARARERLSPSGI